MNPNRRRFLTTSSLALAAATVDLSRLFAQAASAAQAGPHDINNPLTSVLTNSSMMLDDLAGDEPRREELQTIVNETLRCRKIVKGRLEFARQTRPQKQALSLNQVVEDILGLVRHQASFRNLTIVTELDPNLPAVMADGDQMRQVILNVILNAADAMAGSGSLRIASQADASAQTVAVRISDTGAGIPDEVKEKLFEPFFTTKSTGTGLGLGIAYGIMEQHKGGLSVDSAGRNQGGPVHRGCHRHHRRTDGCDEGREFFLNTEQPTRGPIPTRSKTKVRTVFTTSDITRPIPAWVSTHPRSRRPRRRNR